MLGNKNKFYENPLPARYVSLTVYAGQVVESGDGSCSPRCVVSTGVDGESKRFIDVCIFFAYDVFTSRVIGDIEEKIHLQLQIQCRTLMHL